jgi:uncharacterized protein
MNAQEKELVSRFLEQLKAAQAGRKDPEAEALIREACARQPDAAYLLVQRAVQLEELLQVSQSEVQKLKSQLDAAQPSATRGFLNDANAWGRPAAPSSPHSAAPQRGVAAPPPTAAAAAPSARAGAWGSGLFGNIASTAAGVVAGSFLFQGIQGLMNRGESGESHASPASLPEQHAQAGGPELLNTYETPPDDVNDTFFAESDDSSDFA